MLRFMMAMVKNIGQLGFVSFAQSILGNVAKFLIGNVTNLFTNAMA